MFGRLSPIVKNLLLINIGIFIIQSFVSINLVEIGGLRYIFSDSFRPYQFFTHLFIHGGLGHLFGNMFALFIFGPLLERFWGGQRFLVFYLVTGLGAALLYSAINFYEVTKLRNAVESYVDNPTPDNFDTFVRDNAEFAWRSPEVQNFIDQYYDNPNSSSYVSQGKELARQILERKADIPMVGASGAIFGILMAFGLLFPNTELFLLFFPFPIKAKYFVLFYGLYELWAGFERVPGDNVAHFAHLGGMLFAFILIKVWQGKSNTFY
ncbi:rhomboid family intramembrane serine protease [Porifericola rhodea]|uniref:rhomboid family intramembrane serine protease n=1 Tax=Porifericola rhodea TaxID=930972 RepID=UPI00266648EA|nr:rhomboid family intramembrane serine protease [Porifericola rhodea]WKN33259.1 rhomboid family intramembrane serine protease [Porifericola rhodea]